VLNTHRLSLALAALALASVTGCAASTPADTRTGTPASPTTTATVAPAAPTATPTTATPTHAAAPSTAPSAAPRTGYTQFGYIEGLVKRPSDWVLRFDRAYLCFGNSHDEAGCDNPTRATLDDGSWIINNNPAKVQVPASNSIDIELFDTNTMKHYRQELPAILDMKGGIHWETAASPVGKAAYLTFNAQGSVVKMTEYFMP